MFGGAERVGRLPHKDCQDRRPVCATAPQVTAAVDVYLQPCDDDGDCVWGAMPAGPIAQLHCAANSTQSKQRVCVNLPGAAGDHWQSQFDAECTSQSCVGGVCMCVCVCVCVCVCRML